jgi:uncharacterized protein (DUF362 family)
MTSLPGDNRVGVVMLGQRYEAPERIYLDQPRLAGLVHSALLQAGLGEDNPGTPLTDIIQPGMTVLLKPNWVLHENRSGQGMLCMVTQASFIQAALAEVLSAKPGKVIIGDAPIQSCRFDLLVPGDWRAQITQQTSCPVEFVDFRRTIIVQSSSGRSQQVRENLRDLDRYILFDLGIDSLLEAVSSPAGRFRVTHYNPDEMKRTQQPGSHQYLLCREAFEADVIINLPKLKSHNKAGLTAALKNLVGLNGNKDYLPHHRVGGTAEGGDCYPGWSPLKRMAEFSLDQANRQIGKPGYGRWRRAFNWIMRVQRRLGDMNVEGQWYGNDTVWRMALDLNRLLLYGRQDGTLNDTPVRRIYSLTDAIIAGEGDGPLAPQPIGLGVVTFAAASSFADLVHSALMRFDWCKIPLVLQSFGSFRYPLTHMQPADCQVFLNQQAISVDELAQLAGQDFKPAPHWKGYIELNGGRP